MPLQLEASADICICSVCLCRVLLGLQAEMVPLALQDSQGVLELLAPPESASHVPV